MTDKLVNEIAGQESVEDLLATLAMTDVVRFRRFFRSLLETAPEQVVQLAVRHLADHPIGEAERYMIVLLCTRNDYLPAIFDPQGLDAEKARRVAVAMLQNDPEFVIKLTYAMDASKALDPRSLVRALDLLSVVHEFGAVTERRTTRLHEQLADVPFETRCALVMCLRNLAGHADARVRSKAVMWLCRLRPNRMLVERQLQSSDPRVRANAIEAMWHIDTPEMQAVFRQSLSDRHHRVVANALVGLHYCGDASVFELGARLAGHPSPMFRAAIAWALGQMGNPTAIPTLEALAKDPDPPVRRNAVRSLATLAATPRSPG